MATEKVASQPSPAGAGMEHRPSFITGSRVYGSPQFGSDIDLVILIGAEQLKMLMACSDRAPKQMSSEEEYPITSASLRFGVALNVIAVSDPEVFEAWRDGTRELVEKGKSISAPVTRDEAVAHFKAKFAAIKESREAAGIEGEVLP